MKEKLPEYTVQQIRDMLDASEGFDPEAGVFSLLKAYARLEAERDRLRDALNLIDAELASGTSITTIRWMIHQALAEEEKQR